MKKIADAMNPGVLRVARESEKLKQLVSQCMPAELGRELLFVRVADGRLRITVSNSAWAARVRFHGREIKRRLAATGGQVNEISIHVLPDRQAANINQRVSERAAPTAGAKTVSSIRQVAGSMDESPALAAALARLAGKLDRGA